MPAHPKIFQSLMRSQSGLMAVILSGPLPHLFCRLTFFPHGDNYSQQKGIMKSTWQGFFWAGLILVNCHLSAQTVRTATATASTFNGFVVGVTVDDGGAGYTFLPPLAFCGVGGGAGRVNATFHGY